MLTTLASMYSTNAQLTTPIIVDEVNGKIEQQLKQKIAALPDTADTVMLQVTQNHINQLNKTLSTVTTVGNDSSTNAGILSQMQNQLAALQTAAANGDSSSFDNNLGLLNTELGNLLIVPPTAPFQADQISGLKGAGLGIQSSSYYDLSTANGQAAAASDINNVQTKIGQIFSIVTSNQLVATSLTTSLSDQINSLNTTLQQTQTTDQLNTAAASAKLTQLAQNQEHIIQLALGNTTLLSDALANMATIPDLPTSPFDVLSNAVGATASSITPSDTSSAILSLLA
jgi:hypothetical protein